MERGNQLSDTDADIRKRWKRLLPNMRLQVREICKAIAEDRPPIITPHDPLTDRRTVACPFCEKLCAPRGIASHKRRHQNADSWLRP